MSKRIFIRLRTGDKHAEWLRQSEHGANHGHGQLSDAAAVTAGLQVIVIVPGEDVLLSQASVPGHKRRYLGQMVPYAMEEQLIGDVDGCHFAFGASQGDEVNVAVVNRQRMDGWLAQLNEAGLQPKHLVADTQLLPLSEGHWHGLILAEHSLLRSGPQSGQVFDNSNLAELLPLLVDDQETPPQRITLHHSGDAPALTLPTIDGCDIQLATETEASVSFMAKHFDETNSINLLQGDYSRSERSSRLWRPWKPALALAAIWLLLSFTMLLSDSYRLQGELDTLRADIKQIYSDTFPGAKNIPKPKEMMERQLRALSGGGSGDDGFTALLDKASTQLAATSGLELQRVNYKAGSLDVSLLIGDYQQLEKLTQELSKNSGLGVDVKSAAAQGSRVEARLSISGGAS